MSEEDIKSTWELVKGGEPPKDFFAIVLMYRKFLNVNGAHEFGDRDFAMCATLYSFLKMQKRGAANG